MIHDVMNFKQEFEKQEFLIKMELFKWNGIEITKKLLMKKDIKILRIF